MNRISIAMMVLLVALVGSSWGQAAPAAAEPKAPATAVAPAATAATATAATAAKAPTPEPAAVPANSGKVMTLSDLLATFPKQTSSFLTVSDISDVASKMLLFEQKTGLKLPLSENSIGELLSLKVGVRGGVAQRGAAGVAYLDPQEFKGRNAVVLLPVQDPKGFVEYNAAQEVEKGLYQLTAGSASRFFVLRSGYALFSDSTRTSKAIRDGEFGVTQSEDERKAVLGSDVYLHMDLHRTLESRQQSTEKFRQATTAKILGEPLLYSYSDLLLGYMTAINEVFEELDSVDLGVRLGTDDAGVHVSIGFSDAGPIHRQLLDITPNYESLVKELPLDRSFISAGGVSLKSDMLQLAAVQALMFIMEKSPQIQKKVKPHTTEEIINNASDLMKQITGEFAMMTALPADPAKGGLEANLIIVSLKDPQAFADARGQFFTSLTKVSEEVGSRVRLQYLDNKEVYRDIKIDYLKPVITFESQHFRDLFVARTKVVYGPDGFLYRLAIVKDRLYVAVGSDLSLFHAAIDRALDEAPPVESARIQKVRPSLPKGRNIEYYVSLPAMLSRMFLFSGDSEGASRGPVKFTDEDRKFIEDQGVVGLVIGFEDGKINLDTSLGYDQLAKAVTFAEKYLPPSKLEPTPEPPVVVPATTATPPGPSPEPATTATKAAPAKPSPEPPPTSAAPATTAAPAVGTSAESATKAPAP